MTTKPVIAEKEMRVATYTDIIGPSNRVLGTIEDGGTLIVGSVPGCWGPMITPRMKSGHEVSLPVNVAGAEVGDGLALHIKKIEVQAKATASGTDNAGSIGCFVGDPYVARKCPECGAESPVTYIDGIGFESVKCKECDAPAIPFRITTGYTMAFDDAATVGYTVGQKWAERMARESLKYSALERYPEAVSHSILVTAVADMPGILARVRPMIGNFGTIPSKDLPSSHNAGDFGYFLVGAPHEYAFTQEELDAAKTDGHMDIDSAREGAIVICPVKVAGGGIYCGDTHAMQGDGELATHTTDIVAEVTLQAEVVKGLGNDGPILLPPQEDLPFLAQPYTQDEIMKGRELAKQFDTPFVEEVAPIQVVGTGPNINDATLNGLERTAELLDETLEETKNRATVTGCVEIGRLPGVVTISVLAPYQKLEEKGIAHLVARQYDLAFL
ncbi:MAG: acetamidase/formamidase family protein [Anaerolineae bacterium]